MIYDRQEFCARALIPTAQRSIAAQKAYDETPETDFVRWYARALEVASVGTTLRILAKIDENWDLLIRTYEGPGE